MRCVIGFTINEDICHFSKKNLKKKEIFPERRFPLNLIKLCHRCHVNMTSLIYFCPTDNYERPWVHKIKLLSSNSTKIKNLSHLRRCPIFLFPKPPDFTKYSFFQVKFCNPDIGTNCWRGKFTSIWQ